MPQEALRMVRIAVVLVMSAFAGLLAGALTATAAADLSPAVVEERPDALASPLAEAEVVGTTETYEQSEEAGSGLHQFDQKQTQAAAFLGYRFFSVNGYGGRAAPYEYLHSNATAGLSFNRRGKKVKFSLAGDYLNEKDYFGDLLYDYSGYYRLHLRTSSLWHNLEGEQLFSPPFTLGKVDPPPGSTAEYLPDQTDGLTTYGISAAQTLVDFRFKFRDYPAHLNLDYWQIRREGTSQLRFADASFEGTPNTVYARPRRIDLLTQEGTVGGDAHLGPVDLVGELTLRQFRDHGGIPADVSYVYRPDLNGAPARLPGVQQHNEAPDSRYLGATVRAHSSLAGGLVGAAAYTVTIRENLSRLTDISGSREARTVLQNVAGDLVYTPSAVATFGLKYRHVDIDSDSPTAVTSRFNPDPTVPIGVRPSMNSSKDTVTATLTYRPWRLLTAKGEYKGEFLSRDNVSGSFAANSWLLPASVTTNRGTFGLTSRPTKGLRLQAQYSYLAANHPSYGASFSNRQDLDLLATYSRGNIWGATAGYRQRWESNDQVTPELLVYPFTTPLQGIRYPLSLPRDKESTNVSLSAWVAPLPGLTLSGSYAFLRSHVDQTLLYTSIAFLPPNDPLNGSPAATSYTQQAQLYGITASYQVSEAAELALAFQEQHSYAQMVPESVSYGAIGNTSGITGLSQMKTRQTSFTARGDWRLTAQLRASLAYGLQTYYDDYSSASLYDGTVHQITAALKANW